MFAGSPEVFRLLVRLAFGDAAGVEACLGADGEVLARLAREAVPAGLAAVVWSSRCVLPEGTTIVPEALTALEGRVRWQRDRTALLLETLAELQSLFREAGVPLMLLKGPGLAQRYYGDVCHRGYGDLDVLVPLRSRRSALGLIEAAGFRRLSKLPGGPALNAYFVHGFDYVREKADLDVHWRLSRHPSLRVDESRLWAERGCWQHGGLSIDVLSELDDIVLGAIALVRDAERGGAKAKNVLDLLKVMAAADALTDWDMFLDRCTREGTHGPVVNVAAVCLEMAGTPVVAPRLAETLARHRWRIVRARAAGEPLAFLPATLGVGNRWWAARVYDGTPLTSLWWWACSLPFRMAVHQRSAPRSRWAQQLPRA
jgi:hypothetical protein